MPALVRHPFWALIGISVFTLLLAACGGGGGGMPAPSALSYPTPPAFVVNQAITPLTPTVTGTVTSYTVNPALPAGLALSATTGVISGAPTVVTATARYTVTASNSGGSTTASVSMTVNAQTYSIGGSVTGLSAAGLSLSNGSDSVAVGAGQSSFTFPTRLTTGKTYSVTIKTQPSGELCYVTNGSGTVAAVSISNVAVTCGAHNFWALVSGSDTALNGAGSGGVRGVAAATNLPASREGGGTWTDGSGNLWLFGGAGGAAVNTLLADLWMYSPSSAQWTWVSGSSTPNDPGVYGTQGVAAAGNYPPARWSAVGRVDALGNLWLFGGAGTYNFETVTDAALNDLWEFSPATGLWTWQAGTQGVLNPTPPSEPYQILPVPLWIDANNAVWQYGSATEQPTIGVSYGAGFSRFDPATGQWSNLSSPALQPAGRTNAMTWIDGQGRFWMFGGSMSGNFVDGFAGGDYGGLWEYLP